MKILALFFWLFQNANISPTPTPSPMPDGIQITGVTIPNIVALLVGLAAALGAIAAIYKYVWSPLKKVYEAFKTVDKIYSVVKDIAATFGTADDNLPKTISAINTTLAELQAMVELILQNSPTATYLMDEKGQCTYVNDAWSKITGLSKEKAMGNGWTKAIHDLDRQRVFDEWVESRKDERPFACDFRFVNQHSSKISHVRASSIAVKNKRFIIVAYIGEVKVLSQEDGTAENGTNNN